MAEDRSGYRHDGSDRKLAKSAAAEKNSEKTRLARDVERHDHPGDDDATDAGTGGSAKRKS